VPTYREDEEGNLVLEKERGRTEVYSRVVGYLRPVEQWNAGKQAEFEDRKVFRPVFGDDATR